MCKEEDVIYYHCEECGDTVAEEQDGYIEYYTDVTESEVTGGLLCRRCLEDEGEEDVDG